MDILSVQERSQVNHGREIGPFVAIQLIGIFILILVPDIALFLPQHALGA